MRSGEYNVIVFFSARESYATVVNVLKTINLEELGTYFKWKALRGDNYPHLLCHKVYKE